MKLILMLCVVGVAAVVSVLCETESVTPVTQKDINSLLDPNLKLDPKLRRALLKVLTDLENQDTDSGDETDTDGGDPGTEVETRTFSDGDSTTEENTYLKKVFNVHAFSADNQLNEQNASVIAIPDDESQSEVNFAFSQSFVPTQLTETIDTSATGVDAIQTAARNTKATTATANSIAVGTESKKSGAKNFVTLKPELAVPKPTAETEVEGEAGAKVEEVQFFPAPLVAAFTVHQDARGQPQSIVPLYRDNNRNAATTQRTQQRDQSASSINNAPQVQHQQVKVSSRFNVQASSSTLEDKQRVLEHQLFQLQQLQQQQQQQRQQDYLLKQQQLYHEQQVLQARQRQHDLDEQRRVQQLLYEEEQRRQQFIRNNNLHTRTNTVVSLTPSISTVQQPALLHQQQLPPNREAVDFLANLRRQNLHQLPLQQNHIPLNFNQALPPQQQIDFQPLNSAGRNRVFRHEAGTGNFGTNNGYNTIQEYRPQNQVYTADRQLKNLLYQSGIGQGRQEDLNIVSKVLSLNHFGGDFNGEIRRAGSQNTFYFRH